MIIKVKSPAKSDGWFIYDNAESVFFSRHPLIQPFFRDTVVYGDSVGASSTQPEMPEMNVIGHVEGVHNFTRGSFFSFPTGPHAEGWHMTFCKGEEAFEFFGDTEAYLLNDAGKTIERVF